MKRLLDLVIAAALGALVMLILLRTTEPQAASTTTASQVSSRQTFDPNQDYSAAKELVAQAINERFSYTAEVACPRSEPVEKGHLFRCEALVRGRLVPVTLQVISPLGFLRVAHIGY